MHPNVLLLERFCSGIQDADIAAVRACCAPDVVYSDPVFDELHGDRAIAMWDMFFTREEPPRVTYGDLAADDLSGSGRWEACSVFSKTGRPVHNAITSQFRFAEHRIAEQRDSFNVHRWAAMALGPLGRLAGWSPPLRWALHNETVRLLDLHQTNTDPGAPRGRTEPGRD